MAVIGALWAPLVARTVSLVPEVYNVAALPASILVPQPTNNEKGQNKTGQKEWVKSPSANNHRGIKA